LTALADALREALSGGSAFAIPLALIGGVVSGLNPCCLPLYPAAAAACCSAQPDDRRETTIRASAFVLGIALATTTLGVAAAFAGRVFQNATGIVAYVAALVPLAMGLHLLGVVKLVPGSIEVPRTGRIGLFLGGFALALVLAPCATPILAAVLSFAAFSGAPAFGGLLLFTYGLGLALPIVGVGAGAGTLVTRLARSMKPRVLNRIIGALLIVASLYLVWRA
jgi:cytochrome c biogenesis protein CcdA